MYWSGVCTMPARCFRSRLTMRFSCGGAQAAASVLATAVQQEHSTCSALAAAGGQPSYRAGGCAFMRFVWEHVWTRKWHLITQMLTCCEAFLIVGKKRNAWRSPQYRQFWLLSDDKTALGTASASRWRLVPHPMTPQQTGA
jgi:hypothetical protein